MATKKTITEVITPWVEELTKAQNALIAEEEKMNQIEKEYLATTLALKEKITAESLVSKQQLSDDLEKQNQVVLYYQKALNELIKAADNHEVHGEVRKASHDNFIDDEITQANTALSEALTAFVTAYDNSMKLVAAKVVQNNQEIAPLANIVSNNSHGTPEFYRDVQNDLPVPRLMNSLKNSQFHTRNIEMMGIVNTLKDILKG